MPAPQLIQAPTGSDTGNNSSQAISGTVGSFDAAVTAGSTLIAVIHNNAATTRTYGVSDDVDGAWTALPRVVSPNDTHVQLFYIENHTGGTVTVTVTSNFNTVKRVQLLEIEPSTLDVYSTISSSSASVDATLGYPCSADATVIDTSANVFVISAVTLGFAGTLTGGSGGYTTLYTGLGFWLSQYLESDSALTNERGWIAEAGTDRSFAGVIASFVSAAASIPSGSGTVTGAGALTGAGNAVHSGAATVAGTGALAGAGSIGTSGAGTVTGAGAIAGEGAAPAGANSGAGTVSGTGALAGEGAHVASGSGDVTGASALSGAGTHVASGAGGVAGAGTLTGGGPSTVVEVAPEPTGPEVHHAEHYGGGLIERVEARIERKPRRVPARKRKRLGLDEYGAPLAAPATGQAGAPVAIAPAKPVPVVEPAPQPEPPAPVVAAPVIEAVVVVPSMDEDDLRDWQDIEDVIAILRAAA